MIDEKGLPDLDAAGNVRPSIRLDLEPVGEEHHVGVGPKHRTRRPRAGDAAPDGGVEALHARGLGQIFLGRAIYAGEGVIETRHPAVVLAKQLVKEQAAIVRGSAHQLGPGRRRPRATGNDGLAVSDLKHSTEEIEYVRKGLDPLYRHRLSQLIG